MNSKEVNKIIEIIDWSIRNGYVIPTLSLDKEEYEEVQSLLRKLLPLSDLDEERIKELKDDYDL